MNFESLLLAQANAFYGWMMEEGFVPHIVVDNAYPGLQIPSFLMASKHTVLNISMTATEQLQFREAGISFTARFNGRSTKCHVPLRAIAGFLVKAGGQGHPSLVSLPMIQCPDTPEALEQIKPTLTAVAMTPETASEIVTHEDDPLPAVTTDPPEAAQEGASAPTSSENNVLAFGPRKKKQ